MPEQEPKAQQFDKRKVVALAFELGYIIALPIVFFGLLGKYLDERLNTDPYLKISGLILAIVTTTIWLARRFSEIFKSMKGKWLKPEARSLNLESLILNL